MSIRLAVLLASAGIATGCTDPRLSRDGHPRDGHRTPPAAAAAPALPPADLPDAAIVRAQIAKTEVVHREPSPELQAAADEYANAKAALDRAPRAARSASCAELRRTGDLTVIAPALPARFPPVPADTELCGWRHGEHGATELVLVTTADSWRVHRYYQDALLALGHTIEPWDPEATGTTSKAFDFGNIDWGGSVYVDRDGEITIDVQTYPRQASR